MSSSPHTDAFARVSHALLSVWPAVADQASGLTKAEMGRVLDECGSDHRPLVDLLLDLGRVVRPALRGVETQSPSSWVNVRAPLVHRLVSTRYLQPDVARWAVDVWGQALGVAPALALVAPTVETATGVDTTSAASTRTATGASSTVQTSTARTAAARPPVLTPQQVPAAMKQLPSWAGGPVSFRTGQKPKSASLAQLAQSGRVVVRGTVPAGPMFQPAERRAAFILGGLLVLITGGLMNAFRSRPTVTTPVDAVPTAGDGERAGEGAGATGASTTGAGTTGASTTGAGTTGAGTTGTAQASDTLATEMVASSSLAPSSLGPSSLGSSSHASSSIASSPVAASTVTAVRDAGVGGTYLVAQRVRDVSGSASCEAVAQALAAGRESLESVSHVPGQPMFTLVTRGVTGTLDSDGEFVSELRTGTTNNVNWRFRMRGRFGPDGFTGESVTYTDAILRWGKTQTCVVTAELTGRRRRN